jgi:hypothetical protein
MFDASGATASSEREYPIACASCAGVNVAGPQQPPPAGVQHADAAAGAGDVEVLVDAEVSVDADGAGDAADAGDAGDWRADHEPTAAICAYPARTWSRTASGDAPFATPCPQQPGALQQSSRSGVFSGA